jgi:hypothetical protein
MPEQTKKRRKQSGTAFFFWWIALMVLLICCYLVFTWLQTAILLQQRGVFTQGTIVATSLCSLPNRQPDSSASQQGFLLTLRFTDANGRPATVTFPGCQQGVYHSGDRFPLRYMPGDPTTLVRASPGYELPDLVLLVFPLLGLLLSAVIVIVGALKFLDNWRLSHLYS